VNNEPVEILEPRDDQACCCCGVYGLRLNKWVEETVSGSAREHQHCDLCFQTFAGNACTYPLAYDLQTGKIMQHINAVANLVLREFKK